MVNAYAILFGIAYVAFKIMWTVLKVMWMFIERYGNDR